MENVKNIFAVDDLQLADEARNFTNYEKDEVIEVYIKKSSWDTDFEFEKISISKNSPGSRMNSGHIFLMEKRSFRKIAL